MLEAVTALNASLLANQGMIAIADTDTPVEGASRPATPPVAEPVKDIAPNARAAVATLGAVQRKVVEDLEKIRPFEPNVVKAAWAIFGDSYRYRQGYNEFKAAKRAESRATEKIH